MSRRPVGLTQQRIHIVCPEDRVVHIVDVYERVKKGTPASAIADEIGVTPGTITAAFKRAGFEKANNLGRPRNVRTG